MRQFLRIGIVVLVLASLVGGGIFVVKKKQRELRQVSAYGSQPRPVTVTRARKGDLALEKTYVAEVEPTRQARVAARVTAEIRTVHVDEGDRVATGDVLAELEATEIMQRMEELAARKEQAKAELAGNRATVRARKQSAAYWQAEAQRDRTLADKGAISESAAQQTAEKAADFKGRLEAAQQQSQGLARQIDVLSKQQEELRVRRGYYRLRSPFDGVVSQRQIDVGDMATPSQPLFTVQDQSGAKLVFDIPQKDLPEVRPGLTARFRVHGKSRQARISLMEPTLDQARMMRAEIALDRHSGDGLPPGAYVPLTVQVQQLTNAILLPASALIEGPQGTPYVFTVRDGRLAAQGVEILGQSGDTTAVSGVEAQTTVIENTYLGWAVLSSGQAVEPIR